MVVRKILISLILLNFIMSCSNRSNNSACDLIITPEKWDKSENRKSFAQEIIDSKCLIKKERQEIIKLLGEPEDGPQAIMVNSSGKHSALIYMVNEEWFLKNEPMQFLRIELKNDVAERVEIAF